MRLHRILVFCSLLILNSFFLQISLAEEPAPQKQQKLNFEGDVLEKMGQSSALVGASVGMKNKSSDAVLFRKKLDFKPELTRSLDDPGALP